MTESHTPAQAYARIRHRITLANLFLGWFFLAVFQFSGFSHVVASMFTQATSLYPAAVAGYLEVFGLISYLFHFPVSIYSSFFLEHRFGLSRMSFGAWVVRELKQLMVGGLLGLLVVSGFYAIVHWAPHSWPFWATLGWVVLSVGLAQIFPTILLPIFFKTTPLEDKALVKRLTDLCSKVGVSALGVYRFQLGAETRKANAALAGLGNTRRVLLADTLIDEFTHDEIEGVLAHELAHHQYGHIKKSLLLASGATLIGMLITQQMVPLWSTSLRLQGVHDIAGFPMLALWLSVLQFVFMPIRNGLSRRFEWQADHFASKTSAFPQAFSSALRRLADINLADPNPPKWVEWLFLDHPPIQQRIRTADDYARSQS